MTILFKPYQIEKRNLNYIPRAALIGMPGVGMTTLFNKIYRANRSKSKNEKIELIETSTMLYKGSDNEGEIFSDTTIRSLTRKPLNTIFILVPFETRFVKIERNIDDLHSLFENVAQKVVIIVTFADISKKEEKEKNFDGICEALAPLCDRVIFYSKYSEDFDLLKIMYYFMSNMDSNKLAYQNGKFSIDLNRNKKHGVLFNLFLIIAIALIIIIFAMIFIFLFN